MIDTKGVRREIGQLRSLMLYPVELRVRLLFDANLRFCPVFAMSITGNRGKSGSWRNPNHRLGDIKVTTPGLISKSAPGPSSAGTDAFFGNEGGNGPAVSRGSARFHRVDIVHIAVYLFHSRRNTTPDPGRGAADDRNGLPATDTPPHPES